MWKNQYQEELFSQLLPYLCWKEQKGKENRIQNKCDNKNVKVSFFGDADLEPFPLLCQKYECLILHDQNGFLAEEAKDFFPGCFEEHPDTIVAYADEDYLGTLSEDVISYFEKEELCTYQFGNTGLFPQEPWLKPDYSPDTLQSFFYFGNIIAVNLKLCQKMQLETMDGYTACDIYQWILKLPQEKKYFYHVPEVLFTNGDVSKIGELQGKEIADKRNFINDYLQDMEKLPKISVVIPSKDNPQILERCLTSFLEKTKYPQVEFVIVDNGSNLENKQWITNRIQKLEQDFHSRILYLYEPMSFNFSKMCNIGVRKASGDYILLLNDDMEIMSRDWLSIMLLQAMKPHTGAVGAKLYYPNSRIIQHAGITNMGIGPAHKLGGLEDDQNYYHGKNLLPYNMIAVTAACLLVSKEKYEQVGGMDEELEVAYNDVDFCFKLFEEGYYNVVRNDVTLYHHESLSRGQEDSAEKKQRLYREKQRLYDKHPDLQAKDPFYHKALVQWKKDTMYHFDMVYPYEQVVELTEVSEKLPVIHRNSYLKKLTGEQLSMLQIDAIEEEDELIIRGWHVLQKMDNSQLEKYLLLLHQESGKVYQAVLEKVMRLDVEQLFAQGADENTKGTALSGFSIKLDKERLPQGQYEIGVLTTNIPRSWRNMIYQGGKIWTRSSTVLKRN